MKSEYYDNTIKEAVLVLFVQEATNQTIEAATLFHRDQVWNNVLPGIGLGTVRGTISTVLIELSNVTEAVFWDSPSRITSIWDR